MKSLLIDLTSDPHAAAALARRLPGETESMRLDEIRALGAWGTLRRLRRGSFARSAVLVNEFRLSSRWLRMLVLALLPRAGERTIVDRSGEERPVSWRSLLASEIPFVFARGRIVRRACREARQGLAGLARAPALRSIRPSRIAIVRADLGPSLRAGGSLAHLQGVVGGFAGRGRFSVLVSPAAIAGFEDAGRGFRVIPPDPRAQVSVEVPHLAFNQVLFPRLLEILRRERIDLVYQRHALGAYAGAAAAQAAGLPLVVEFNGSEVWIAEHWGAARRHMDLFGEIERRVLGAADLVVAVAEPLRTQLRDLGVPDDRILIQPNGVDVARFDPATLAAERGPARERIGVEQNAVVVVFVGTFGPWHGAEVLARAALALPAQAAPPMRFLFVGDGPARASTEAILREGGRLDRARFTGLVPPDETPFYLAAADLCVSPQVSNPDGTPFFGSPTKLFEYMASARAVVASRVGQIAEVLEHGRNGWLVPPGDAAALADALVRLAADRPLRERLGAAAAADAGARHTWDAHVSGILDRLANPARGPGRW